MAAEVGVSACSSTRRPPGCGHSSFQAGPGRLKRVARRPGALCASIGPAGTGIVCATDVGASVGVGVAAACAAALWILPSRLFAGKVENI